MDTCTCMRDLHFHLPILPCRLGPWRPCSSLPCPIAVAAGFPPPMAWWVIPIALGHTVPLGAASLGCAEGVYPECSCVRRGRSTQAVLSTPTGSTQRSSVRAFISVASPGVPRAAEGTELHPEEEQASACPSPSPSHNPASFTAHLPASAADEGGPHSLTSLPGAWGPSCVPSKAVPCGKK